METESRKEKLKSLARHDAQGRMLSGTIVIFELRAETEEQAKNTQYSQDLFVLGMAKLDKGIGPTMELKELVLELEAKDGPPLEAGPRQSIVNLGKDKYHLKLGKAFGKEAKATPRKLRIPRGNNSHAINHPKVKELAAKAVGDAKDPREKVKRIVQFVHDYVRPS